MSFDHTDTHSPDTAPDVKSALTGFAADFRGFRSDLDRRLAEQATRLDALDRKAVAAARSPLSSTRADIATPHRKAFAAYVRQGDEDRVRSLDIEEKLFQPLLPVRAASSLIPRRPAGSNRSCAPRRPCAPLPASFRSIPPLMTP